MNTITFTFESGFVKTLTHHDPEQIKEWLRIFDNPEARAYCKITDISVGSLYSEAA